jgi:hypothetical protein
MLNNTITQGLAGFYRREASVKLPRRQFGQNLTIARMLPIVTAGV